MKILSVSAQKPHSTGSGVYLTELVKSFDKLGCEQVVISGIYKDDDVCFPKKINFDPMLFKTNEIPFAMPGMSDEMPYESTVYSHMTEYMVNTFCDAFKKKLIYVVKSFNPDLIICHHLYLLTALVRDLFPNHVVVGICHGTDLRQMKKNKLKIDYIKKYIKKLDVIYSLHDEQKKDICQTYGVDFDKINVIGSGYNRNIFYNMNLEKDTSHINLIFAGKLNQKKGVMELVKALNFLPYESSKLTLKLAGGNDNTDEYCMLKDLISSCKYEIKLLGKLSQKKLAYELNISDIFILPSFFEGLPLVLIEALACGLKVISTDLPGIKQWMDKNVPNNNITYVELPKLFNTDEIQKEELPNFQKKIAMSIEKTVNFKIDKLADLSKLSWDELANRILLNLRNINKI